MTNSPDEPAQRYFWPRIGMLPDATQAIWMVLVVVTAMTLIAAITNGIIAIYNSKAGAALDSVVNAGDEAIKILVGAFAGSLAKTKST